MRTYPTGTPPASQLCARCSGCAPRLFYPESAVEPPLHAGRRRPRLLSRTLAPHRMPCFRLSAVRNSVQPAAELRHLQRHNHGRHVLRALLPVACSQSAVEPSPARCVNRGRPPPPAARSVSLAPHRMPSFRLSAVREQGVQPAVELRHLQRHGHEPHVQRALLPVPCPQSAIEPSPARCVHRGRPQPPTSQPAPRPAPYALLATLGRSHRRSTSR
eukprot:scaffold42116_cov53-Phaeocystis_antarctica.AAC.2